MFDVLFPKKFFETIEELELYIDDIIEWCDNNCKYSYSLKKETQKTIYNIRMQLWFNIKMTSEFGIEFESESDGILFALVWG